MNTDNAAIEPVQARFNNFIRERWNHPLGGPYLFAWAVLNREFLIIAFSDAAYNLKIADLTHYFSQDYWGMFHRLGLPLLAALVYVAAAPISKPLQEAAEGFAESLLRRVRNYWNRRYIYTLEEFAQFQNEKMGEMQQELIELKTKMRAVKKQHIELMRERNTSLIRANTFEEGDYKFPHGLKSKYNTPAGGGHFIQYGMTLDELVLLGLFRTTSRESQLIERMANDSDQNRYKVAMARLTIGGAVQIEWDDDSDEPSYRMQPGGESLARMYAEAYPHLDCLRGWR